MLNTTVRLFVCLDAAFSEEDEVRPDFEDLSAEAAWGQVTDTLQRCADTQQQQHSLHLAAIRAALAKERRLKLPAALLAPFQVIDKM